MNIKNHTDEKILDALRKYKKLNINGISRKTKLNPSTVFRHLNNSLKENVKVVDIHRGPSGKTTMKIYKVKKKSGYKSLYF